jgi:murein tripeptide amidase MpaA
VNIIAASLTSLRELAALGLDLQYRAARQDGPKRYAVPGVLSREQVEKVRAEGYEVIMLADLSETATERRRQLPEVNRFAAAPALSDMPVLARQGYLTAEEVEDAIKNLSSQHPDVVSLIELPNNTWQNRVSHAVRIGLTRDEPRSGVLFTGSMHAREWGGSDICVSFAVALANAYKTNSPLIYGVKLFLPEQVRSIVENLDVFVFPDVNPDGKHKSQTDNFWWRKNCNPNMSVDPRNPGVDVNRNFDFLWDSGIGTSDVPEQDIYKGTSPFSEPETRNVRHMFDAYSHIRYYVDIHSYSGLILHSWGDDDNQTNDPSQNFLNPVYNDKRGTPDLSYREYVPPLDLIRSVGIATYMNEAIGLVRKRQYTVQPGVGLYPTSATSSDYAYSRQFADATKAPILGLTIEFGEEFVPEFNEMQKIIQDVGAAITELCWIASVVK